VSVICGVVQVSGDAMAPIRFRRMLRASSSGTSGTAWEYCRHGVALACRSLQTKGSGTQSGPLLTAGDGDAAFACDARLDNPDVIAAALNGRRAVGHASRQRGPSAAAVAVPCSECIETADASLIFSLLRESEETAAEQLLGDFAYAYWNGRHRRLRLARDAMGMRPLYYRVEPRRVLFASLPSQILAVDGVSCRLNETAVAWYLAGMQVPSGCVFYSGIEEVLPGQEVVAEFSPDGAPRIRTRRYWTPSPRGRLIYRRHSDYAEHLRELLFESMRCRLRARSRVGVSLSGGMDSLTAACVAARLREEAGADTTVRAYTWAFTELPQCDERENVYRAAEYYGIPVREVSAEETAPFSDWTNDWNTGRLHTTGDVGGRDIQGVGRLDVSSSGSPPEGLRLHAPYRDEPFSIMFQPFLYRSLALAAADGISTIFYGNRGDMVCGGWVHDAPGLMRAGYCRQLFRELRGLSRAYGAARIATVAHFLLFPLVNETLTGLIPPHLLSSHQLQARLAGIARLLKLHEQGDFIAGNVLLRTPSELVESHIRRDFLERAELPERHPVAVDADRWRTVAGRQRHVSVFSPLVQRGILFGRRVAAEFGIDFADPWSDRRIAEFVLACPQFQVERIDAPKRLARSAMYGTIPWQALRAAKKTSPEPLYLRALRRNAPEILRFLTGSRCCDLGFVNEAALRHRFSRFISGETAIFDIWSTLSLEMWLRRYWT